MSSSPRSAHRWLAALAALLVALPARSESQSRTWSVRSSPAADLWFHGLAVVGFSGFGDLPLYAPGYPGRVARDRAANGGVTTLLVSKAEYFREAFAQDSAFEVLHFAPLYFEHSEPGALLDALRVVVSRGDAAASPASSAERFGIMAMAAALATPAERRVLGEFVTALDDEWNRYYRLAAVRLREGEDGATLRGVEARWTPLARALAPYLARTRLVGGTLLLSSVVGPDGRLFEHDPRASGDNVLAVHSTAGLEPGDAVYLAVRELCYPAVRPALVALPGVDADRVGAERLSGVAAVRCGALLLERYAPQEEAAYEASWLRISGRSGPFPAAFPIPQALERALDLAVMNP